MRQNPASKMVTGLVDKAIQHADGDSIQLRRAFKAAALGIDFGWKIAAIEDPQQRELAGQQLEISLVNYRTRVLAHNDIRERVKESRVSIPEYPEDDPWILDEMLLEHGPTTIKETAASIWKDPNVAGYLDNHVAPYIREGFIREAARQQLYDISVIGDLVLQRTKEGQSPLPPEGIRGLFQEEQPRVRRERG